jgi:hypothetical protein
MPTAQEAQLKQVYEQGVAMRKQYGGTPTSSPKFPDKATEDKYKALIASYRNLTRSKVFKGGIAIGVSLFLAAISVFFFVKQSKKA